MHYNNLKKKEKKEQKAIWIKINDMMSNKKSNETDKTNTIDDQVKNSNSTKDGSERLPAVNQKYLIRKIIPLYIENEETICKRDDIFKKFSVFQNEKKGAYTGKFMKEKFERLFGNTNFFTKKFGSKGKGNNKGNNDSNKSHPNKKNSPNDMKNYIININLDKKLEMCHKKKNESKNKLTINVEERVRIKPISLVRHGIKKPTLNNKKDGFFITDKFDVRWNRDDIKSKSTKNFLTKRIENSLRDKYFGSLNENEKDPIFIYKNLDKQYKFSRNKGHSFKDELNVYLKMYSYDNIDPLKFRPINHTAKNASIFIKRCKYIEEKSRKKLFDKINQNYDDIYNID